MLVDIRHLWRGLWAYHSLYEIDYRVRIDIEMRLLPVKAFRTYSLDVKDKLNVKVLVFVQYL